MDTLEVSKRPYPEDDVLTSSIYEVAQQVDRILNRCSVQDHMAIMGMIQVTGARRGHEYQERNQRKMQEAQQEAQKRADQNRLLV